MYTDKLARYKRFLLNSKEMLISTQSEEIFFLFTGTLLPPHVEYCSAIFVLFNVNCSNYILLATHEWVWCIGGMTFRRKLKYTHKDLSQCHFATSSFGLRRHRDMQQNAWALARPCRRSIRSVHAGYNKTASHKLEKCIFGNRNESKLPKCAERESPMLIHKRPPSLNWRLTSIQMKKRDMQRILSIYITLTRSASSECAMNKT
jgi:hypothetical protein